METSVEIRNKLCGQTSELLEWIHLIESKRTPCRIRIEETEPISGKPSSWKVVVFKYIRKDMTRPFSSMRTPEASKTYFSVYSYRVAREVLCEIQQRCHNRSRFMIQS
ncbi:hypothetical protein V6Z79_004795 [Aspergillus fumigatus]